MSLQAINEELKLVDIKIKKELMIKQSGHAGQFAHLEFSRLDSVIRPAITLLSGKVFSSEKNKVVHLASILQFIYMSSQIHAHVTESDAPVNDIRDGFQFPVLVGDYLFGKFFTHLSEENMLDYLGPLAEVICRINEGAALRNQHPKATIKSEPELVCTIVRVETAELFASGTSLAAKISGADDENIQKMYKFGLNFGMGFGLLELGASYEYVEKYFDNAQDILRSMGTDDRIKDLDELLGLFKTNDMLFERMVG